MNGLGFVARSVKPGKPTRAAPRVVSPAASPDSPILVPHQRQELPPAAENNPLTLSALWPDTIPAPALAPQAILPLPPPTEKITEASAVEKAPTVVEPCTICSTRETFQARLKQWTQSELAVERKKLVAHYRQLFASGTPAKHEHMYWISEQIGLLTAQHHNCPAADGDVSSGTDNAFRKSGHMDPPVSDDDLGKTPPGASKIQERNARENEKNPVPAVKPKITGCNRCLPPHDFNKGLLVWTQEELAAQRQLHEYHMQQLISENTPKNDPHLIEVEERIRYLVGHQYERRQKDYHADHPFAPGGGAGVYLYTPLDEVPPESKPKPESKPIPSTHVAPKVEVEADDDMWAWYRVMSGLFASSDECPTPAKIAALKKQVAKLM